VLVLPVGFDAAGALEDEGVAVGVVFLHCIYINAGDGEIMDGWVVVGYGVMMDRGNN
jgi:hypothetical protein